MLMSISLGRLEFVRLELFGSIPLVFGMLALSFGFARFMMWNELCGLGIRIMSIRTRDLGEG